MQRIVIRGPGGFNRLQLVSEETPAPGPGEVLIETRAVGVNFADCVVRLGLYPSAKEYVGWPITPGFEFSGVVTQLGAGVSTLAVGDEVFGATLFGGYSSHVVVPESQVVPRPAGLSFEESAAIPVSFLTAWYALVHLGGLSQVEPPHGGSPKEEAKKRRVLVHSAAGGVGGAMVQIAVALGCEVTAIVGAPNKVDVARAFGAAHVLDKSSQNWVKEAARLQGDGYHVICDANGVETLRQSYKALRPTGRLIVYGAHTMLSKGFGGRNWLKLLWTLLRTPRFDPLQMTNDNKSVLAFNLSYLMAEVPLLRSGLHQIVSWFTAGQLVPPQITTFPLAHAKDAHAALQSGTTVGKLLLLP